MSKNVDFPKLGPYSHKIMVRIEIGIKIRQPEVKQIKMGLTQAAHVPSRVGRTFTSEQHARVPRVSRDSTVKSGTSIWVSSSPRFGRLVWTDGLQVGSDRSAGLEGL